MTKEEHLDKNRFPLTTQRGSTLIEQMMIDAHNLDEARELLASGKVLSARQQAAVKELEAKQAFRP